MTDWQKQASKGRPERIFKRFKKWLKNLISRSTSPQPSAFAQENPGGESSSVQQVFIASGGQLIVPVTGSSAAPSQQDHCTLAQSVRSQPTTSGVGLSVSAMAQDQHNTPTQDSAASISPTQHHGAACDLSEIQANPEISTSRTLSTAKDIAGVTWRFTEMLLKRLPDAVDMNPAKIAFGIVKIVLQIKDDVKGNIDAVGKRILSTAEQLRTVEDALNGWKPNTAEEKHGIELYQITLREEMIKLIKLKEQSRIRAIADHEADKGRIADIFERINQAREQLVIVTGLQVQKTVTAIQKDIARLLLKELKPSDIADHKFKLEGKQRQLLRRAVCTPGTRVDILANIAKWANDDSPTNQSIFWLFGQAGSGKSTIAYTIARRFEFASDADDTIILGGNFFCSRQIEETRSAKCIIRTIVYHLALKCKSFADALHASGDFDTINQAPGVQLEKLLIEPWKQAQSADSSKSLCFLIVIDALDEIEDQGGSEFLRVLINGINKHHLRGLKFFATSRPDPMLVNHVESFKDKQFYRLEQLPMEKAEADIAIYLNANLPELAGSPEMAKLVRQAAGLFIYAATVVKYLAGRSQLEQKGRIHRLPDSGIPQNLKETPLLDSLYLQVLQEAFKSVEDDLVDFQRRLKILHTLLCSAEPPSISLVAELLFPPNTNESKSIVLHSEIGNLVLASLNSVLYTESGKVFSYHKSFIDFIFDGNRAKDFSCDQAQHHLLLARSCFHIMDGLKFNIANITSSFLRDADNSTLPFAVMQNIPPVLSYSCRNWDYHVLAVALAESNELCSTIWEFLELRILFWIEAMNLLGLRGQCERMLRMACNWVTKNDAALAKDLIEAASFALHFSGSEWMLSTPHLYISALATWQRDSRLSRRWRSHFPGIPRFTHKLEAAMPLMTLDVGACVNAVAISSDNRHIVSGSQDKSVRVWDASTGKMLKVLEGHIHSVTSVAFSSNNQHIGSGSEDASVRVWDASTGEMLKELEGHAGSVNSVTFSSDNRHIVSGSDDKSVRVWDASMGEILKVLDGHTGRVTSVAFSSDNQHIGSGSEDASVRVWDASTGEMLKKLEGHAGSVNSVTFSSNNQYIVSGSGDKSVRVWDASMGKMLRVLEGHTDWVRSVAFSSNNRHIVSGSHDNSVRVWDASTGEMLRVLKGHTGWVKSVAFSTNNQYIVSSSGDNSVRVWDASMGEMLKVLEGHTSRVTSVAFSSNNQYIVSSSGDHSVRVWDALTGEMLKVLEGHTDWVTSVAFLSNNRHIVSGSHDNSVRVWNASTGRMLKKLEGHTDWVTSVAFSSDNRHIVSGSHDNSVRVWDASTGEMLKVLEGHTEMVTSVAFSTDNRHIVSGSDDNSVRVWDALTGKMLKVLEGHANWVNSVAFSSDNQHIVSGSHDNSVRVWDASTGEMLKVLEGHANWVTSIAFSGDNQHIVSGSDDKSVRVWDASTGEVLNVLEGHTSRVTSVAFSSDNAHIVSGSEDNSVRVWALPTPQTPLQYIRQKTNSFRHQKHTGWLLSPQTGQYLMYVPPAVHLPDSSNIFTMSQFPVPSVDFTSAILGPDWHRCFSPTPVEYRL